MKKNNLKQPKSVAEKIRQFRDEFTKNYMDTHKKFDIYDFTAEFLKKTSVKKV